MVIQERTPLINDESIELLRREIGVTTTIPQYNRFATEDAIRHYALGIGDDNPRWTDPDYGITTRWNGQIAPASFVFTAGWPRSRGLPGVHGLFTGVDLHCHRPVPAGGRIAVATALHDVVEREGRYAGRQLQQIYETTYSDETGTPYSTLYSHAFRTERSEGAERGKYRESLELQHYDDAMLADIAAAYALEREQRRGAVPRHWEDVEVGEDVGTIVKGPLTVTDCICFLMGFGYIYVKAHRQWHEFLGRHPGAGVKNEYGIWDIPERVHWEHEFARDIGMPGAYDYGPQRIAWFEHCASDWMGDDGWIKRLSVRLRAPNFIGDTTYIRGHISEKSDEDSSVTLTLEAVDQRARRHATGEVEVVLPRRTVGR